MSIEPVALASMSVDEAAGNDREYWRRKLAGERSPFGVPLDRRRPAQWTLERDHLTFQCGADVVESLRSMCGRSTPISFVVLLTVVKIVLHKYSGASHIVVGTTVQGGAATPDTANQDLALCDVVAPEMTARQLMNDVKVTLFEAFARQRRPFAEILSLLDVRQGESRGALFDVAATLTGLNRTADASRLRHDVTCTFSLLDDSLSMDCEYRSALFDKRAIEALGGHVTTVLRQLLARPDTCVADLDLVSADERRTVTGYSRGARLDYPGSETVVTMFEAQADRTPAHVAVATDHESITYGDLNRRANQLARHLRQLGVAPETVVGVFVERSIDLSVTLLGVLKAGGAYAPLDTSYPAERLALMVEDAGIEVVVIADAASRRRLPDDVRTVVSLVDHRPAIAGQSGANLAAAALGDHPAYVIFTSGSTGRPKGVLVSHGSLVNHMVWMQRDFPLNERDRVLQRTPVSFDASVWEFWAPLLSGARLCLARAGLHHDTAYLKQAIVRHGITTLQLVPSLLRLMLGQERLDDCGCLRRVFCGGEPLTPELQELFFSRARADLHNLYGPTEATVEVTAWSCERDVDRRVVPLGRPIANADIWILDNDLRQAGINLPGEVYIGGRPLARGYVGRPDATAERFLPNPFVSEPGARMYRSGDIARWLPDGTIEFLGRRDQQVKLRGLRIEPGEIETVLGKHPGVRAAAVAVRGEPADQRRLVAYVVLRRHAPPAIPELSAFLRQRLPEYMVPSPIVPLPALPLNPSGKVDYRALPDPFATLTPSAHGTDAVTDAPRDELVRAIADSWKAVLRVDAVGVHDNFFDVGGHSLLVLQVHARLRKALDREIDITDLFRYPTVHALATHFARATRQ